MSGFLPEPPEQSKGPRIKLGLSADIHMPIRTDAKILTFFLLLKLLRHRCFVDAVDAGHTGACFPLLIQPVSNCSNNHVIVLSPLFECIIAWNIDDLWPLARPVVKTARMVCEVHVKRLFFRVERVLPPSGRQNTAQGLIRRPEPYRCPATTLQVKR